MPIDLEIAAEMLADHIDELPTECLWRGRAITIRAGEAPQTRSFLAAGISRGQSFEALMKLEDADPEPLGGEPLTIGAKTYKVGTVVPLLSLSTPAGYRLTLS